MTSRTKVSRVRKGAERTSVKYFFHFIFSTQQPIGFCVALYWALAVNVRVCVGDMDTLARISNNTPISCIHPFRSQSPHFPTSFAIIRVGRGSLTPIRASTTSTERGEVVLPPQRQDDKQLQKGIAEFYDESSSIWEDIWGDHMHHGFYDPDSTVSVSDHRAAQIRMIEESLRFASISGILCISSTHSCFHSLLQLLTAVNWFLIFYRTVCIHTRMCTYTVTNCFLVTMVLIWNLIFWYWILFCFCSGCSEERTKWPKRIVDVGCGIGGSSRYLAEKFGATSVGITLSPVQAQRANALAAAQGLAQKVLISGHLFLLI